jgi:hypothetical protein
MSKQNFYNLQLANDKKMGDIIKEVTKCEPTCWHGLQNSQWSVDVIKCFPIEILHYDAIDFKIILNGFPPNFANLEEILFKK